MDSTEDVDGQVVMRFLAIKKIAPNAKCMIEILKEENKV